MNLSRFMTSLPHTNPNYSSLGQLMFVPHGSSGTATLQTPETTVTTARTGDCFSITIEDEECFTTKVSESECFYTDRFEKEREEKLPPFIVIDGFSSIICIHAHGLGSLKVIGMYTPPGKEERAVLADILYQPSIEGGYGKLLGVLSYTDLAILGMYDITKVDRLDGYDITKTTSSYCVVYDGEVYWINPAAIAVSNDTEDHITKPIDDCFFDEYTYQMGNSNVEVFDLYSTSPTICRTWLDGGAAECPVQPPPGDSSCYTSMGAGEYQYGESQHSTLLVHSQLDGTESDSGTSNRISYVADEISGVPTNIDDLIRKREGIAMLNNGDLIFKDTFNAVTWKTDYINHDGVGFCHFNRGQHSSCVVPNEARPNLPDSGRKLYYDGEFITNLDEELIHYTNKDGTITGTETGPHYTLLDGKLIIADGSEVLRQIDLNDIE